MDPKPLSSASKAIFERLSNNMRLTAQAAQAAEARANEFLANTLAALEIDPATVIFDVKSMSFVPKPAPAAPSTEPAP